MPLGMDEVDDVVMSGQGSVGPVNHIRNLNGTFRPPISIFGTPLESTPDVAGEVQERLNIDDSEDYSSDSLVDDDSGIAGIAQHPDEHPPRLLPLRELPTGLCYDDRMRYHAEIAATSDFHPEDPRRIYYIYKELCQAGLVDDPHAERPLVPQPLFRIPARKATKDEILEVHTAGHYDFVEETSRMDDDQLLAAEASLDSIYFNNLSYFSSLLSCGGAIDTCRAVVTRQVRNAIAVIRPPGHHAEPERTMGFCLFNNVCVATKVCQREYGESCRKVMILDWDVHHGNGVQTAFYDDPNVLYVSIHVYQDGRFYPGGPEGDMTYCGDGAGIGKNVNIPWPTKGMGDGDYMFAFQQIVMPIANEFSPDLVIISAGFDAAAGDELGGCFVTPACYAHMTHMLTSLANGKIAVCLEGGYNFRSISKSALAVTRTLMGEPPDRLPPTSATDVAIRTVRLVQRQQSRYWRCMFPVEPVNSIVQGERMHDVLRQYQAKHYYDAYKMTGLYVFRSELSKSFRDQVLATPSFDTQKNLLVIFHDPPDVIGSTNPMTGQLELQNTWLADEAQGYIKWAVDHKFGVVDVNIPTHITDDSYRSYDTNDVDRWKSLTEKLAMYLWDNYIEVADFEHVFMMGIGNAFYGIARLLTHRDRLYENVSGIISFVADNPLLPVKSSENHWLQKWYANNSLNLVAPSHGAWTNERKISKRYGNLVKSSVNTMPKMLDTHQRDVFEFIAERAEIEIEDETTEDVETEDEKEEDMTRKMTEEVAGPIGLDVVVAGNVPTSNLAPTRPASSSVPPSGVFRTQSSTVARSVSEAAHSGMEAVPNVIEVSPNHASNGTPVGLGAGISNVGFGFGPR